MQTQELAAGAAARADIDPAALRRVLEGAVENLVATWSDERSLFPFSSRLSADGIANDYDHPVAVRYTINSLLGLSRAEAAGLIESADVESMTARFLETQSEGITSVADLGLLLNLLVDRGMTEEVGAWAQKLDAAFERAPVARLNVQDVAWAIWGASEAGANDTAFHALRVLREELVEPASGLPRHSVRRYRRRLVSFGGLVYYLRALEAAATILHNEWAEKAFRAGVERALALQGPQGEWPWLLDVRSGRPVDTYPVFAVHQDSMAMLFLLPALDRELAGASEAIHRSLDWCTGANELGAPMYVDSPCFFAYRSIERTERAPRLRRYVRSLTRHRPDFGSGRVRLNDECRSYHLGWILYAWSTRPEALRR